MALATAAPTPSADMSLEARQRGNVVLNLDGVQIQAPIGTPTIVAQMPRQHISFVSYPSRVACQINLDGVTSARVGMQAMRSLPPT
jgi:hypothetical protein